MRSFYQIPLQNEDMKKAHSWLGALLELYHMQKARFVKSSFASNLPDLTGCDTITQKQILI